MRAYKCWRWDRTDWHTGRFHAVAGKTLVAPDWKEGLGPDHCGNGFHSHPTPEGCWRFVNLGPISEVEIVGACEKRDKIRSEKIRIVRWLSDAELALAAKAYWGADYDDVIPRLRQVTRNPLRATEATKEQRRLLDVWASVRASVGDSVGASAGYACVPWVPAWRKDYPYQAAVDLWLSGCVPSIDSKVWRLHGKGGGGGEVIHEQRV